MAIAAQIMVRADRARVWEVLTDLAGYKKWNPFMPEASGSIEQGGTIKVFIRPPGQSGMWFRSRLLVVQEGTQLIWRGSVGFRGLLDGTHTFTLEDAGERGVLFSQSETFSGLLAPIFVTKAFKAAAIQGFDEMNSALKQQAETE